MNSYEVYFKLEKLDHNDNLIAEMSPKLLSGEVRMNYQDVNRRVCQFDLLEALPDDWMSARWKLYYGRKTNGVVTYDPLGIFLPVDPEELDELEGKITRYSGIDKANLLSEAYSDIPLTFEEGTSLKEVMSTILDLIGEQKRNLADVPFTLTSTFTFAEGISLEHIASTLIRSFQADWYYDVNGFCVLEALPVAELRPIAYEFEPGELSIHTDSTRRFDTARYWNRVVVVGGTADTGIFRQTKSSAEGFAQAGRWISEFFKEDTASSQAQVNDLADQFLDAGLRLPASLILRNLPLTDLEPRKIIKYEHKKYELTEVTIPLSVDLQRLEAGEVL